MEAQIREEIRQALAATGESITDAEGNVLGYVAQPARFKIERPYLARGGFLVVTRDEEYGHYVGMEFDALPHPKSGEPYPAGQSQQVWRAPDLETALQCVMAYFAEPGVK